MTVTIPILKLDRVLLLSIQVDMDDETVAALESALTQRIVDTGARGVVIELSAVDVVDSFVARMLANIAAIARLLDARTVLVGMRPAVAVTLVELGLSLEGILTALDLEGGMALLASAGE